MTNPTIEPRYASEFLLSEANGYRSREARTLAQSQSVKPGDFLGQVSVGALTGVAAAKAGNTGNGTMGAVTVAAGTGDGVYNLEIIEPAANAGAFRVEGPDGVEIGHGTVGVAFTGGGLGFTLADGATDFVSGDGFTITVSDAAATDEGQFKKVVITATDGSQVAKAIHYGPAVTTAAGETVAITTIEREAEVKSALLDTGASLDDNHKAAALAQLASAGIVARS